LRTSTTLPLKTQITASLTKLIITDVEKPGQQIRRSGSNFEGPHNLTRLMKGITIKATMNIYKRRKKMTGISYEIVMLKNEF